eukprot:jgi/Hompol1/2905/HPOL_006253-RA
MGTESRDPLGASEGRGGDALEVAEEAAPSTEAIAAYLGSAGGTAGAADAADAPDATDATDELDADVTGEAFGDSELWCEASSD